MFCETLPFAKTNSFNMKCKDRQFTKFTSLLKFQDYSIGSPGVTDTLYPKTIWRGRKEIAFSNVVQNRCL